MDCTSDPGEPCTQWTIVAAATGEPPIGDRATVFRACSTKGKGRKDSIIEQGDFHMPHGLTIKIKP